MKLAALYNPVLVQGLCRVFRSIQTNRHDTMALTLFWKNIQGYLNLKGQDGK